MPPPATKARILAEAQGVVAEHGAAAVTMRGVAARVGVTPMALYRHFAGREALLTAIIAEGHATFLRYLQRAMAEPTAERRFFGSGEQYLAFALDHPRRYAVLFMQGAPAAVPTSSSGQGQWEDAATFRFLVDRLRDCATAGVLTIGDAEDAALTVWAHVHGLVSLYLAGKLPADEAGFRAVYARSVRDLARAFGWRGPDPKPPPSRATPRRLQRRPKGARG